MRLIVLGHVQILKNKSQRALVINHIIGYVMICFFHSILYFKRFERLTTDYFSSYNYLSNISIISCN